MLENLVNLVKDIFLVIPLGQMTGIQIVLLVLLSIAGLWLIKKILKYVWIAIKSIFKAIKNTTSAKEKCKKIQCIHCGRTLDKCICEKNRKKSAVSRLLNYKKEMKNK